MMEGVGRVSFVETERGPRYPGIWMEGELVYLACKETRAYRKTRWNGEGSVKRGMSLYVVTVVVPWCRMGEWGWTIQENG